MATQAVYPMTHQGVRDLDNPVAARRRQNVGPAERVGSALLGGLVVGYGLMRRDLVGLLAAAAAAGLICRGVTGHCAVYEAAGVDTAH